MREILFRGKRIDNGEWLYGNIQVPRPPFDRYFMWDDNQRQHEVIPETVGQFTGLTDKNGKRIFEGDVCKVKYYNHSSPDYAVNQFVSFENGTFTLNSKDANCELNDLFRSKCPICFCFAPNTIEVIGSIHDNPEFLKGDEP